MNPMVQEENKDIKKDASNINTGQICTYTIFHSKYFDLI